MIGSHRRIVGGNEQQLLYGGGGVATASGTDCRSPCGIANWKDEAIRPHGSLSRRSSLGPPSLGVAAGGRAIEFATIRSFLLLRKLR